jgi:hypothetical protein
MHRLESVQNCVHINNLPKDENISRELVEDVDWYIGGIKGARIVWGDTSLEEGVVANIYFWSEDHVAKALERYNGFKYDKHRV